MGNVIQLSPFITLSMGSMGMDHVISESCFRGTNLQWNYRKMTILWLVGWFDSSCPS